MIILEQDKTRSNVRESYTKVALSDCSDTACGTSCCSPVDVMSNSELSLEMGYSPNDLASVPDGANMGLGCGNPNAIASLRKGETVLDLGSGGGFDCFLAANAVGDSGYVIGVDMTPEMVSKARKNSVNGNFPNVDFRLGEIENLPVADNCVDVIISNCVINLSPDKKRVFQESFRVLKSGGRLAISDVVAFGDIPVEIKNDLSMYSGCISGAATVEELTIIISECGFVDIKISPKSDSKKFMEKWTTGVSITDYVISASIEALKP